MRFSTAILGLAAAVAVHGASLVETLKGHDDLKVLTSLLSQAEYAPLLQKLEAPGRKVSIFAPTNTAFAKAKLDTKDAEKVVALFRYHITPGELTTADLGASQIVDTLLDNPKFVNLGEGVAQKFKIIQAGGNVILTTGLGGGAVTEADIKFDSGVIHKLDTVLSIPLSPSETLKASGKFKTLGALLKGTGLGEKLNARPGTTVFVPTDAAFDALTDEEKAQLNEATMRHHVLPTALYSSSIESGDVPTLSGKPVTITVDGAGITVGDKAKVATSDVFLSSGVAHVVDAVIIPSA